MVKRDWEDYIRALLSNGGVAQLGEHLPCKQGVRSSILLISTTFGDSGDRWCMVVVSSCREMLG